jgi:predicted ATPase/DNA-binding NarL/FixJ family response regulator
LRILIAEDSDIERLVLQEVVESIGHEALVANDGAEAWEVFQQHRADVLVTDWLMPGLQGPELCRLVRGHPTAPYTYVILLTALDDRESMLAGMAAGADDYLTKPLDVDDLEGRLVAAERVTQLHRQLTLHALERERTIARREALVRLAGQLAAESDPDRLLGVLLAEATALLGATAGIVSRWDPRQQLLSPIRSTIPTESDASAPALARQASNQAVARRRTVVLDEPITDDDFELRAVAATPLIYSARLLGALTVAIRRTQHFSAEDLQILEEAAEMGSAALVGLDRARTDGALLATSVLVPVGSDGRRLPFRQAALPVQPTSLVGREDELGRIRERFLGGKARLVTLTGPAGIGKTRVAVAAAAALLDVFPEAVHYVDLHPVRDSTQVLPAIAAALGAEDAPEPAEWLETRFAAHASLLVVDTFEHVLAAAADLADLVERCPGLKVLVTSREPLRVRAEHEIGIGPLATPRLDMPLSAEAAARSPAVALFVERAAATDVHFQLTDGDAEAIARICQQLDGVPLAIELAAARIRSLTPEALQTYLDLQPLGALGEGARDAPERHQTLRAALSWSYELLTPVEQRLFRRLGVFAGPFSLDAGVALGMTVAGRGEDELAHAIESLESKSLLVGLADPAQPRHFRMLETVRQYALEKLTSSGELRSALEQHCRMYVDFAERADTAADSSMPADLLRGLEAQRENLDAAVRWASRQPDAELELRLCTALTWFWLLRGSAHHGLQTIESALERSARTTGGAGRALQPRGAALLAYAQLAVGVGDWRRARRAYEQRLAIGLRDYETLLGLAASRLWLGERGAARSLAEEVCAQAVAEADRGAEVRALGLLGEIAAQKGEFAAAAASLSRAVSLASEGDDVSLLADVVESCAALAAARRNARRAVRLASAVSALREAHGARTRIGDAGRLRPWLALAREQIGAAAAELAESAGRALTLEEIVAEALTSERPPIGSSGEGQLEPLSNREAEVALLVARGWTNAQIGVQLQLSERTVEAHMRRIIHKLGFASRTQLATWTVQRIGPTAAGL